MNANDASGRTGIRYQPDEKPPATLAFGLGLQLAALSIAIIILIPTVVMRAADVTEAYLSWAVFATVAIVGVGTILQAIRIGRIGMGYLLIMGPSGAFVAVCITAITEGGPAMLATLVAISAFVPLALSWRLSLFQRLLTPTIVGTVIMLIPITIMPAVFNLLSAPGTPAPAAPLSALVTLLIISGIALKATGVLRPLGAGYRCGRRFGNWRLFRSIRCGSHRRGFVDWPAGERMAGPRSQFWASFLDASSRIPLRCHNRFHPNDQQCRRHPTCIVAQEPGSGFSSGGRCGNCGWHKQPDRRSRRNNAQYSQHPGRIDGRNHRSRRPQRRDCHRSRVHCYGVPSESPRRSPGDTRPGLRGLFRRNAGGASAQEDISAYFLDPDADALSFASVSSAEQVASARMAGSALAVTPLSVGQAIVTVTATDARGLHATLEVAVSVSASSSERARSLRTSLSALGRTMGSEAVEMVTTRFEDTKAGAHMRLGGEALSCRGGCDVAPVVRLASRLAGISAYGREQGASPWDAPGLAAPMQQRGLRPGMSGETLLRGSAFRFSDSGSDLSRGWALWGRGRAGRFRGRPLSGLSLSGRTWSGYAGADYRLGGRTVAGVALSRTAGDIEITSALNGESGAAVRMTSVMPYGRWSAGRGLSFWGLAGGGRGVSELTEASGDLFRTDLFMTTGAVGMSQSLGQRFSLEADAFRVRIRSEETQGLEEVTGSSHRIRLAPSWKMRWTRGASRLNSSLSAGARLDGGDAERGLGAEAGLALGYAHAPSGIALDAKTRMLLVHEEEGFREWGASLSFKIKPGGASGVSLSVKPAWGNAASRAQDLWGGRTALREWVARSLSGSSRGGFSPQRLDVEVGYGIVSARGKKVTPFGRWTRDALGGSRLDVGAKASLPAGRAAAAPRTLDVLFNRETGNLTLRAVWPLADR